LISDPGRQLSLALLLGARELTDHILKLFSQPADEPADIAHEFASRTPFGALLRGAVPLTALLAASLPSLAALLTLLALASSATQQSAGDTLDGAAQRLDGALQGLTDVTEQPGGFVDRSPGKPLHGISELVHGTLQLVREAPEALVQALQQAGDVLQHSLNALEQLAVRAALLLLLRPAASLPLLSLPGRLRALASLSALDFAALGTLELLDDAAELFRQVRWNGPLSSLGALRRLGVLAAFLCRHGWYPPNQKVRTVTAGPCGRRSPTPARGSLFSAPFCLAAMRLMLAITAGLLTPGTGSFLPPRQLSNDALQLVDHLLQLPCEALDLLE